MTAQPPHNNRPDNQADWPPEPTLQDCIDAGMFPTPEEYEKMIWIIRWYKDRAAITTKIAEERLAELNDLWMLYDEDCEVCCENKETIEVRIAELEALKNK